MSTSRTLSRELQWCAKVVSLCAVLLLAGCLPNGDKPAEDSGPDHCDEESSHKGKGHEKNSGNPGHGEDDEHHDKNKKNCDSTSTSTTTSTSTSTSTQTDTYVFPDLPNRVCTIDKFTQQGGGEQQIKKVDILFVMDHSGSMKDDWERVATNIQSLVKELPSETSVRYAVLLADVGSWKGKLYAPAGYSAVLDNSKYNTSQISTLLFGMFNKGMEVSDSGSGEASFHSLYHAVTTKAVANQKLGFFRPDAALSVIFMSDEHEIGFPFPEPQAPGLPPRCDASFEDGIKRDYYDKKGINLEVTFNAMKQLKGDMPVKTHAFVNITKEDLFTRNSKNSKCLYDSLGYGYMEMVEKTKGVLFSIQADKADGLARCGKVIRESLELQHEFPLSKPADKVDPATVLATVDGALVTHEYRVALNSVYLENAGSQNSHIEVRHCEPDGRVDWNLTGFNGTPARFSVGLSWSTAEYATSGKVIWGADPANMLNTVASSGVSTNHVVTASNLSPNTVYHFQAISWDEFGQEKRSEVRSFRTLPDWSISDFGGTAARTSASLHWTTSEYATKGRLYIGLDAANLSQYGAETVVAKEHGIDVTGLDPDTVYYFQAASSDEFGLEKRSEVISLRTQPDWGIVGFKGSASRNVANLTWSTPDQVTNGKVRFGSSPGALGQEISSAGPGLNHAVTITGLNPGSNYYFQAVNTDGISEKTSNVILIRTADDWEISGFVGQSTQTTVSLSWNTNGYNTSGRVYWGESEAGLTGQVADPANGQAHALQVAGLNPDTLYYFQASSTDEEGIEKRSEVVAIRTAQIPLPTWAISNFAGTATKNAVTLNWNTDQYATSGKILWGATLDSVTGEVNSGGVATSHSVIVDHLIPDTIYYFMVVASDDRGQVQQSDVIAIRTMKDDVVVPPSNWVIVGFDGTTTSDQANLIWQTPGAETTAVIKVGLSAEDLTHQTLNVTENLETHVVGVSGLNPDTTYFFQVIATDSAGRTVESVVISKRTKAQ